MEKKFRKKFPKKFPAARAMHARVAIADEKREPEKKIRRILRKCAVCVNPGGPTGASGAGRIVPVPSAHSQPRWGTSLEPHRACRGQVRGDFVRFWPL